ncbi:MAG: Fic family protein [Burkholderiales bacterium]|nr:Fic family protein [Burkholderiales bacterium]
MIYTIPALPDEYLAALSRIDGLRRQLKHSTSDNRRRWTGLLRSAFALAIQGSNSIEGFNVTYDDAMAAVDGEEPMDAKQETWLAIKGYQNALTYILQLADDQFFSHSEALLRSLHFMMIGHDMSKHPGIWRPGAIWVRRDQTGETVYEGPDVTLVPALMAELVASLNDSSALPVMVKAALAHLNLVMVHPFSDGNGRMGRALQTLVLAREGIIDPLFSSIEEPLAIATQAYYNVLAEVGEGAWNPRRSPLAFIRFCLLLHHRQAETWLWRMKRIDRVWAAIEDQGARLGLNERTYFALGDAAMGIRVTNSRYRKLTDLTDQVASKDLAMLTQRGLLVAQGERRGRHYVAGEWLAKLRDASSEKLVLVDPFSPADQYQSREIRQEYLPGLAPGQR